jgi:hypothetical protein
MKNGCGVGIGVKILGDLSKLTDFINNLVIETSGDMG